MASGTARSVVLLGYGSYDQLEVRPWPVRSLGPGDVRVDVAACGMNFADLYTRQGLIRTKAPPFVLGMECSGTVTAVGDSVTHITEGDRVLCYQYTGDLFREQVVVAASHCFVLPSCMSFEHGAALAANYLTAYFCILDIGHLRTGQSVLIGSCAGGVGWAATQLARSVGSVTIFGTCSPEKHEAVRQNGVTYPLNPDGYEHELRKLSPGGVDVVIDTMGGRNFSTSQQLLKPLGRAVLIGSNSVVTGDQKLGFWSFLKMWWNMSSVSVTNLIMQNIAVAGLHLGLLMEQEPDRVRAALDHLYELYKEGKIEPRIDSVWPLHKVVDATKVLAERRNIGKVLLQIK